MKYITLYLILNTGIQYCTILLQIDGEDRITDIYQDLQQDEAEPFLR